MGMAKNPAWGKLGPNWEGPYRITSIAGIGDYFLEDLDENVIPCPWLYLFMDVFVEIVDQKKYS